MENNNFQCIQLKNHFYHLITEKIHYKSNDLSISEDDDIKYIAT